MYWRGGKRQKVESVTGQIGALRALPSVQMFQDHMVSHLCALNQDDSEFD